MKSTKKCMAITTAGKPCPNHPMRERDYCFVHDPDRVGIQKDARRRGGVNNKREVRAAKLLKIGLNSNQDMYDALLLAFAAVHAGDLDPEIGRTMAIMARAIRDLGITVHLEAELERIHARLSVLQADRDTDDGRMTG